jgi:hypothetical protein
LDPLIKSQLLYQLSYAPFASGINPLPEDAALRRSSRIGLIPAAGAYLGDRRGFSKPQSRSVHKVAGPACVG